MTNLFAPIPVYDRDGVTVYQGDCLQVMPCLTGLADLVLADLPYATTRNTWDRLIPPKLLWSAYRSLRRPTTPVVLFGTGIFAARMIVSNEAEFRYDLIWDKQAVSGFLNAKRQPLRAHESLLVFYDRPPTYHPQLVYTGRSSHSRGSNKEHTINHYGRFENTPLADQGGRQHPRSILTYRRPKGRHPTQKPVALCRWAIESYTDPGAVVLDNVAGSGTSLVAARAAGRRAIGIELHEEYAHMIIDRLESGSEGDTW